MIAKEKYYSNLKVLHKEDYQKYLDEQAKHFIRINPHPEDSNIVILNYTKRATYERHWTHETMSARGLILDTTEFDTTGIVYILAEPIDKFYNYGEYPEYEKDIELENFTVAMEKMDGSLGISYYFKGEIRWATRGSFDSEQALRANKIWKAKYAERFETYNFDYFNYPFTMLTEIIYPQNRVVVDYGDMEDLVMLGAKDIHNVFGFNDEDWSYDKFKEYALDLKMPVADRIEGTLEDFLKLRETVDANTEGWILRYPNNKRLKIKGLEYIDVHRRRFHVTTKMVARAWSENTVEKVIFDVPEEFRKEVESVRDKLDEELSAVRESVEYEFNKLHRFFGQDRRAFAQFIGMKYSRNSEFKHFLFDAYKHGEVQDEVIKKHIYKEYRRVLGVVDDE